MLKTKAISLGYKHDLILKDISLEMPAHAVTTIIGPNGCGKSTLLKALCRYLKPRQGQIFFEGKPLRNHSTKYLARNMAILPQNPKIPDDFSVRDLVSFGRYPYLGFMGRMDKKDHEIIDWAIKTTHTEDFQHRQVMTLSGGERQRAFIAMALAQQPNVLLLDEPTTFLDIAHQFEILELIRKLNHDMNITTIMVLHDINQAARYSDYIVAINKGCVYRTGTSEQVVTPELLEEVFNIEAQFLHDEINGCPFFIPIKHKVG